MRLCTLTPPVPRTWTVELRPQQQGPLLICPQCTPGTDPPRGTTARSAALAHLAHHARSAALPLYLRTCQCHERGCRWHPRHRGCAGPILLVLTRECGGRIWRLADVCAACAGATSDAAVVPDTVLQPTAHLAQTSSGLVRPRPLRTPHGPSDQVRVGEMLSYLAVALPPETSAAARLLAVQCALRANTVGKVRLPTGLLRSMRLAHALSFWLELEQAHWLRRGPQGAAEPCGNGIAVQLLDVAILAQVPGRSDRRRAADWAAHTASCVSTRRLSAGARLTTLALAAHLSPNSSQGTVEADRLRRACGLSLHALCSTLDQLVTAGAVTAWRFNPVTEDLHWGLGS